MIAVNRENKNILPTFKWKVQILRCLMICIILAGSVKTYTQEPERRFSITYKDRAVGYLKLVEKNKIDGQYLKMISDVSIPFLLKIKVYTEEEAVFSNSKLVYSNFYRKVNGNVKSDKQTKLAGDIYQTISNGKRAMLDDHDIVNLLMLLYFTEPVNMKAVYSGNFQQFLAVEAAGNHKYKIEFPDGSYTYYYYTGGYCEKIEIHHSMYTLYLDREK